VAPNDRKSLDAIEKLTGKPIEKAQIEGVPDAALGDPRDTGGRGRRAEELKRERSQRGGKKDRYMKRDADRPTAATAPIEAKPEASAPHAEPKREARPPREQQRPQREQRPPRDGGGGAPVHGFGDNAPAFLKRK